ncbi:MAG TPA: thioesterase family protein [Acidimicrobiia bacterium]|jgi:acyl-CoA thioester hydrolase|nr:thioesterase family protein [Acidimicrobiia bacterium]
MPSTTITRRVQWIDTDAAGIWHHSVVVRWSEEAEAELHRDLGISEFTFGATPRVRTGFEFDRPVRFDDVVDVTLTVTGLGTTSISYGIEVSTNGDRVARGEMVAVLIDRQTGEKTPWPDHIRALLAPDPGG